MAVVQSDCHGNLLDQTGSRYNGTFDGKNVMLERTDSSEWQGLWIQGSGETRGVTGGGALSKRFQFTFNDHGRGTQRLNASFSFAGTVEEMIAELREAGYRMSFLDSRFNHKHNATAGGRVVHLRTPGRWVTGADSGHAIVEMNSEVPACGTLHVGEHNPITGMGVGFVLHLLETI